MTAPAMPMPTPIQAPADFPVSWNSPEESMLLWEQEQMHMPHSITPLSGAIVTQVIQDGLGVHLKKLGAPVMGVLARRINTYIYQAAVPDFSAMEGAEERVKASVAQHGFGMYQRWETELLPRIEAINAQLLAFDYVGASLAELAAQFDRTLEFVREAWDIHFTLLPGFYTAPAFKGFCAEALGVTGLEAYEMMQGSHNMSVESGSKLWQLAQTAPKSVRRVIETNSSAAAMKELWTTAEGRTFLEGLRAYLDVYGWRTGSLDLATPSWCERPELALDSIRLMFRAATDPADDQKRGAERAEALANQFREKLAGNPELLGQFEFLLGRARDYPRLQENHNFYLDQKLFALTRLITNEVGARAAVAGVIPAVEDIHYLLPAEIQAFLAGSTHDMAAKVAERKAEMDRFSKLQPPLALGSRPPMDGGDPFLTDFFGKSVVEPAPSTRELQGTPSSRGKVTGTARVIRTLAEAERLKDGDILVCDMTTPAWTPLFGSLSAIVSDSGGPLSHCAVVAREYGVPCVTGTRIATTTIPDGATITVDGSTGLVIIER